MPPYYLYHKEVFTLRKVVCRVTGEYGTSDKFYKVIENGKNKYYKSEEIYKGYKKQQLYRQKTLDLIFDLLGYEEDQYLPPMLLGKIKKLNNYFTYEVIYETFQQSHKTLQYWINIKEKFSSEYSRINYMMAIIQNKINSIGKQLKRKKLIQIKNIDVDMEIMNENLISKKTNKIDISDFL